jgi:hypothetical protein
MVYGTVDAPPAVAPPSPTPAVLDFVTITPTPAGDGLTSLEFWFHPQPQWPDPLVRLTQIAPKQVVMAEEPAGPSVPAVTLTSPNGDNVWIGTFKGPNAAQVYRRIVFSVGKVVVELDGSPPENLTLPQWMAKANITFEGWDPTTETITTYLRLATPS